jgi:hypothetical protein
MKRIKSKLEVKAETIRQLSNDQMQHIAGGTLTSFCVIVVRTGGCPSAVPVLCGSGGSVYQSLACG